MGIRGGNATKVEIGSKVAGKCNSCKGVAGYVLLLCGVERTKLRLACGNVLEHEHECGMCALVHLMLVPREVLAKDARSSHRRGHSRAWRVASRAGVGWSAVVSCTSSDSGVDVALHASEGNVARFALYARCSDAINHL